MLSIMKFITMCVCGIYRTGTAKTDKSAKTYHVL